MDFQQQIVLLDTQSSLIAWTYCFNCLYAPNKRNSNIWSYFTPGHAPKRLYFLVSRPFLQS